MLSTTQTDLSRPSGKFSPFRWLDSLKTKGFRHIFWYRFYRPLELRVQKRDADRLGNVLSAFGLKIDVSNPIISPLQKLMIHAETHEEDEIRLARLYLDPALPTVELGGSIGVLACLTNKMTARPTEHVVVEALPPVLPSLEANRALNGCKFEILNAAVAYGTPTVDFFMGQDAMTGTTRSHKSTKYTVRATSLKEIVDSHDFETVNLIVDIEGSEIQLVANEIDTLKNRVKIFILETHERMLNDGSTFEMLESLNQAGFRVLEGNLKDPFVFALVNSNLGGPSA